MTAAITDHRVLQPADARVIAGIGVALLLIAAGVVLWPRVIAIPAALLFVWTGGALLVRAVRLRQKRRSDSDTLPETPPHPAAESGPGPLRA